MPTKTTPTATAADAGIADAAERARIEQENHEYLKRAAPSDIAAAGVRNGMSPAQQVALIKAHLAQN
jgi:hypothetical protein